MAEKNNGLSRTDKQEARARLAKLRTKNSKRTLSMEKNDRENWESSDRTCYRRDVCQWPEEWDTTNINLCGADAPEGESYCSFHKRISTQRSVKNLGTEDVAYLERWWAQTY